jgi:hypothetical protein
VDAQDETCGGRDVSQRVERELVELGRASGR